MQENIIIGVLKVFASEDQDNQDMCLKMNCSEYMKNFYNDHNFKVSSFAHLLPPVITMANQMMLKCSANMEAVNEILELFRFIIDKYAAMSILMPNGQTANEFLLDMFDCQWTFVQNEF